MEVVAYIISAFFISITILYIFMYIHEIMFEFKVKYIVGLVLSVSVFVISYMYLSPIIKPLVIMLLMFLELYFVLNCDFKTSILDTLFLESTCIVAETIYSVIFYIVNKNDNLMVWNHSAFGVILTNIIIPLIMIGLIKTKIWFKLYGRAKKFADLMSTHKLFLILVLVLFVFVVLFYTVYYVYYTSRIAVYIVIVLMFVFYTILLLSILFTSSKYERVKDKYTISLENLKSYEEMLTQYRVNNHENKNQLLLIRNMVKDEEVKEYIDRLIDNKEKDDNNIYNMLKKIPLSIIRAVIYSKLIFMKNKKINYSMNIDRKLSSKDFANIPDDVLLDICNILNIFIDNAIDASVNSTERQILIEFEKHQDEIEIVISNTFDNDLDLNVIYSMGYSTKGGDHGYGLPIVKSTINKDSNILRNEAEKIKDVFIQHLYIKIKKCS